MPEMHRENGGAENVTSAKEELLRDSETPDEVRQWLEEADRYAAMEATDEHVAKFLQYVERSSDLARHELTSQGKKVRWLDEYGHAKTYQTAIREIAMEREPFWRALRSCLGKQKGDVADGDRIVGAGFARELLDTIFADQFAPL